MANRVLISGIPAGSTKLLGTDVTQLLSYFTTGDLHGSGIYDVVNGQCLVSEASTPDMSVDIDEGVLFIKDNNPIEHHKNLYTCVIEKKINIPVAENVSGGTLKGAVVAYIDLGAETAVRGEDHVVFTFIAGDDTDPLDDWVLQDKVDALVDGYTDVPFTRLSDIDVADSATEIENASITDTRTQICISVKSQTWANGKMYFDPVNGRLGIGTSSPTHLLHIVSSTTSQLKIDDTTHSFVVRSYNATGTHYVTFDGVTASNGACHFMFNRNNSTTGVTSVGILLGNATATFNHRFFGQGGDSYLCANNGKLALFTTTADDFGGSGQSLTVMGNSNSGRRDFVIKGNYAHGMTTFNETNTYFSISPQVSANGGAIIRGNGLDVLGFGVYAAGVNEDTTNTSSGNAPVEMRSYKKDGTGVTNYGSTANIFAVKNGATTRFLVRGDGQVYGVGWNNFSDKRMKENIKPLGYGLAEVMKIEPSSFDMFYDTIIKSGKVNRKGGKTKGIGFIADDILNIIPEAVTMPKDVKTGFLTLKDYPLLATLWNAVRELTEKINKLEAKLSSVQ
jgi:hypothetical protein